MIGNAKLEWMKSAHIIKFPEPVSYMYQFPGHDGIWLLTEKDIAEKSLEELRAMYEKDREEARYSARTRNGQRVRRVKSHAAENADNKFFVIPDNDAQTLLVTTTEEQYSAIRLDRTAAQLLANIIIHQIQKW